MFAKLNLMLGAGIVVCLAAVILLRRDDSQPNYELVPERQMARSPAFGAFTPNPNFADAITFRQPAAGTIARGVQLFPYGPTPTEAARAGTELANPLSPCTPATLSHGTALYATFCQCCHGRMGNGDGPVAGRGFPAPLSFLKPQAMNMKDGEMFHILTYGKGNMPAHALQLSQTDRWAVINYVRVLQDKYTECPTVRLSDTMTTYKANCLACHGDDGSGRLLRGKYPNLPDFSSLAWQFSKTSLEITNRIEYGDEPMMPAFRYKLTREQIFALSVYIRSFAIKQPGAAPTPEVPVTAAGMTPKQIFRAYCLACHNANGKGDIVRPVMPDIPDFTIPDWHTRKSNAELSKSILGGGKFMPPMRDKLTAVDADKMAAYIRGFKDGKQVVELEPLIPQIIPVPKVPDVTKSPLGPDGKGVVKKTPVPTSPETLERLRGAGVRYREYCIACHGPDGTGVAAMRATMPRLPDFTRIQFRDQYSDPQLVVAILDGNGFMPANRGRLTEGQARDMVTLIRTFAPPIEGDGGTALDQFQQQFQQLQQQWEALEREVRALKKSP